VNLFAVVALSAAFALAIGAIVPASRRSGLGPWHPAAVWIAFQLVFFGVGAAVLSLAEDRAGPALYVAGAIAAFGTGVVLSDRLARRHSVVPISPETDPVDGPGAGAIRWGVAVALVVLGIVALVPTLVAVGVPFLAKDVTDARVAVGGLDLQLLRVAVPGAVLLAVLVSASADQRSRTVALVAFGAAAIGEVALASRYLSAELVAAVVLGFGLARRRIPRRAVGLVAAAGLAFVVVGVIRAPELSAGRELEFAVNRTVSRIFLVQPRTLDALQAIIPAEQPFFGGLTWVRRLAPLAGRDDVPNLGYWIYPRLFPDQATAGYAAPGLLGEAWANLGWAGLAVFGAFGVLTERLGALLARRRRFAADIAAGALAILFVGRTHAVGLDGLAVLIALVSAWRVLVAPLSGLQRDLVETVRWRT
jgi:hypothetical protein